jgi:hypothetical protein
MSIRPRGIVRTMATFFKTSRLWVLDYTWHGRSRRWYKALPEGADAPALLAAELAEVQGPQARLVDVRPATAQQETQYLQDKLPKNMLCLTGRRDRS